MSDDVPRSLRGHPTATDFLIVGPEHLLGDDANRERLMQAMEAAFPGCSFGLSDVAFGVEPELGLVPMCGYVGASTNDELRGLRSPPSRADMDAMCEALNRFSRGRKALN